MDAEERVPDGPPVRRSTCGRRCDTRWDREPTHSKRCDRQWHELMAGVNQRLEEGQRKVKAEMDAYLDYKAKLRGES